jgi:hypothetical protein
MNGELGKKAGRYRLTEREGRKLVVCNSSQNLGLFYNRGRTARARGRRRFGPRTIFLDGACAAPPFHDNEFRQYNFDHHSGCLRQATRSSCEQAAAAVAMGLPLEEGDWTVVANDFDADSLLAAWVLMNAAELSRGDCALLGRAMSLIAAEGCIDCFGPSFGFLSGQRPEDIEARAEELSFIQAGLVRRVKPAAEGEALPALCEILGELDALLIPPEDRELLLDYEELARASLADGKLAIMCRSGMGLLETESFLAERYPNKIALLAVSLGERRWSLKLIDPFQTASLTKLYKRLNKADPLFHRGGGEENAWGGSATIGGSPRLTGTGLEWPSIMEAVRKVFGRRDRKFA